MLESKNNRHLKRSKTPAQRYNSSHVLCLEPEIGSHGDVTSPLRYSIAVILHLCKLQEFPKVAALATKLNKHL